MTPSEKDYKPRPKLIPTQDIDADLDRMLAESSEDYVPPKKSWLKKIIELFEPMPQTYFVQNSASLIKAHMDFHKSLNETHNNVDEFMGNYDFISDVSAGIFKIATMTITSSKETKIKNFYKNKRKR